MRLKCTTLTVLTTEAVVSVGTAGLASFVCPTLRAGCAHRSRYFVRHLSGSLVFLLSDLSRHVDGFSI